MVPRALHQLCYSSPQLYDLGAIIFFNFQMKKQNQGLDDLSNITQLVFDRNLDEPGLSSESLHYLSSPVCKKKKFPFAIPFTRNSLLSHEDTLLPWVAHFGVETA